jgi:hypothetical protein
MMRGSHMHPPRLARGGGRLIMKSIYAAAADFQAETKNLGYLR